MHAFRDGVLMIHEDGAHEATLKLQASSKPAIKTGHPYLIDQCYGEQRTVAKAIKSLEDCMYVCMYSINRNDKYPAPWQSPYMWCWWFDLYHQNKNHTIASYDLVRPHHLDACTSRYPWPPYSALGAAAIHGSARKTVKYTLDILQLQSLRDYNTQSRK
ncbi:hypothetical protein EJ02DRAFT_238553 [Clathrospora elynae]|uniref:Uncharacterized protein n=1 Tax=Clathrospora elynae TaxID=706981 RepID=A0A6A5SNQ6_9PLEO|nr:hypothetical protein EJ02DRAFT_238553 [Clathrospora elynae]